MYPIRIGCIPHYEASSGASDHPTKENASKNNWMETYPRGRMECHDGAHECTDTNGIQTISVAAMGYKICEGAMEINYTHHEIRFTALVERFMQTKVY